ncbi:hypothetical protein Tco_1501276, partial [Tanacetum coccineum]
SELAELEEPEEPEEVEAISAKLVRPSSAWLLVSTVLIPRCPALPNKMTSSVPIIAFHLSLVKANGISPINT